MKKYQTGLCLIHHNLETNNTILTRLGKIIDLEELMSSLYRYFNNEIVITLKVRSVCIFRIGVKLEFYFSKLQHL